MRLSNKSARSRRSLAIGILIAAVLAMPFAVSSPAGAAPTYKRYVALGDSSAAGPLLNPVDWSSPLCLRSRANYPHLLAASLKPAGFVDVTCSGAKTTDFSSKQFGLVAAQYDALTPDTDLVTLSIGANDMEISSVVLKCINLLPKPFGTSCKSALTAGGVDQVAAAVDVTIPKIGAAIDEIHRRSPRAKVVITGGGSILPPGGCWSLNVPIWGVDADYITANVVRLSAGTKAQAAAHGATYVDLSSVGHDVCQAPSQRWVEPLIFHGAAPAHPNAAGMAAYAAKIQAAL